MRELPLITSSIELGTFVFTMVDPHRGHEVEYNRWYERDHFYAGCLVGPWLFAGGRFVAPRALKELRYPATNDMTADNMAGSYLSLYWVLDGHHAEWGSWVVEQTKWLSDNGRMFEHRSHVHTCEYRRAWSAGRSAGGCPAELALDHGYHGLVIVVGDVEEGHTLDDVESWFRADYLPRAMDVPWGPDLVVTATPVSHLPGAPTGLERPAPSLRRFLQLHFLEHDPTEGWDHGYAQIGTAIDASGLARHVWTAPFLPTRVGTDAYTDQLW